MRFSALVSGVLKPGAGCAGFVPGGPGFVSAVLKPGAGSAGFVSGGPGSAVLAPCSVVMNGLRKGWVLVVGGAYWVLVAGGPYWALGGGGL